MKDIPSVIENVKKASAVEHKMGYKNAAVFGGFSAFVISCLNKAYSMAGHDLAPATVREISRLGLLLKKYSACGPSDRGNIVKEVMRFLDSVTKELNIDTTSHLSKTAKAKRVEAGHTEKTAKPKKLKENKASELQFLKSVGPKRVRLLNRLGIDTVKELLYHFPRRYDDRSNLKKFYELRDGDVETVTGTVVSSQDIRPRKGLVITKAAINDGKSIGYAVWFNQPFIKKQIPNGTELLITGKVERKFGSIQVTVSDYEVSDSDDTVHAGRIVPVYPATEGLPARALRSIIKFALDKYGNEQVEFLPVRLLKKYGFMELCTALGKIHFPENMDEVDEAKRRLVFEELFLLQMGICLLKAKEFQEPGISHKRSGHLVASFSKSVPYSLTKAQVRVLDEIYCDMEKHKQMNRLIQGDVGSGKTVLAAAALVKTVENGYQGAMMAPTEILAGQHLDGLRELLEPLGVRVSLLTGSLTRREKERTLDDIRNGVIDIVVGTHAVIQDEVEFQRLGLAVTDEQHRFGVRQRAKLKDKGLNPDILVMTATPIPRTLALTVYGDLDISVIDELPPGRQVIKTRWISSKAHDKVFGFIREQVSLGRQVYYVCPLVEESDKIDVQAAVELAERLQTKVFPDLCVGLMHGRLKHDIKDTVMSQFKNGEINILVATTVVEVGVNVPNATVMVIEDADRFGLAQLHQLRGRVGRGSHQSYCFLLANPASEEGRARMNVMQSTCDGFLIAEEDLQIRGPGEFFGTRQSGMPDLKIADILRDVKVLQIAREEALKLISGDPALSREENRRLKEEIIDKFKSTDNFIKTS